MEVEPTLDLAAIAVRGLSAARLELLLRFEPALERAHDLIDALIGADAVPFLVADLREIALIQNDLHALRMG